MTFFSQASRLPFQTVSLPSMTFSCGDATLDRAYRIALGDVAGNIVPFRDGLLTHPAPTLLAGLEYDTPWTRDTAINVWNGVGLLFPEVARNTLLSVLKKENEMVLIGGQYWDAIIWTTGAWSYYLFTADRDFLELAFEATRNTLAFFEQSEFSADLNLFRGPACYGDGVAAYPDIYARTQGFSSILDWPRQNPQDASHPGFGIPMHALSTNCLYYNAYTLIERMAHELDQPIDTSWSTKARALKEAINRHFWHSTSRTYRYLIDDFGNSDHQEGMGHAFALLFGIADAEQTQAVLENQHITEHGIPCVWPPFERYSSPDGLSFGRHCGVIWPHIQALWVHAVAQYGRVDLLEHELRALANKAVRDSQFAEIYHPFLGTIYGGRQEGGSGAEHSEWRSCSRQTWSATGYLRMLLMGLTGMRFDADGIRFAPCIPANIPSIFLSGLSYRHMSIDIEIHGSGTQLQTCRINDERVSTPLLLASGEGYQKVLITMV